MNHFMNDLQLRNKLLTCAKNEKLAIAETIRHLIEVNRRNLHLIWGHSSLFTYLTDELGYEKGAAGDRVSAVRASKVVPEIVKKIESGDLNLRVIRKEQKKPLPIKEMREIYKTVENQSSTQTQQLLAEKSTSPQFTNQKEIYRPVQGKRVLVQFYLNEDEARDLELAREILSHKKPGATEGDLFKQVIKEYVQMKHPLKKAERALKKGARPNEFRPPAGQKKTEEFQPTLNTSPGRATIKKAACGRIARREIGVRAITGLS